MPVCVRINAAVLSEYSNTPILHSLIWMLVAGIFEGRGALVILECRITLWFYYFSAPRTSLPSRHHHCHKIHAKTRASPAEPTNAFYYLFYSCQRSICKPVNNDYVHFMGNRTDVSQAIKARRCSTSNRASQQAL